VYTIELTDGPGWDAPTLQSRAIRTTVDIEKVAALAADWLHEVHLFCGDCVLAKHDMLPPRLPTADEGSGKDTCGSKARMSRFRIFA
jgi:hypothetical protein